MSDVPPFSQAASCTPPQAASCTPPQAASCTPPQAVNSLGLVIFPAYDWGISPTHPEREERLLYTQDQLREEGIFDIAGIEEFKPRMATMEDVSRVHFCPPGFASVVETPHLISAGSAITAGDLVLSGRVDRSFALTRPPGHHAMKVIQGGRGFCAVNIEAVMIERLRKEYGVPRIAIVDTDCHHGDGTQDVYWHDPDTLFISVHQDGRTLYPGTGFVTELGGPTALGTTINIPLPPKTGDEGFLYAAEQIIRPLLDSWKPDLVINSAGQDNHFSDPITDMRLSAQGYAQMVSIIDPHIAVLEGGYAIQGALPYVNLAVALALAGMDYSGVREPLWRDELVHTDAHTMDSIRMMGEGVLELFERPGDTAKEYTRKNGLWIRERAIYYDTDGIEEMQREEVTDCRSCVGLLVLHTRSSRTPPSVAIRIPRNACPTCLAAAKVARDKARKQHILVEWSDASCDHYERIRS